MAEDIIIRLRDVWKIYKMGDVEVQALRGITIDIKRGEFVSIIGPSGSGKSTCVNMVGCLDVPTKGDIFLEGKNIAHLSESALAQIRGQKIGFVFQQFNLIPTMTAIENVALPMVFQGVPREKRLARARELLEMVELGDRLYHKPTELSGGQQQRVAISRALVNDPDVILADEPTGNLDSKTGHTVLDFLHELHQDKCKTIVVVTHDINVANAAQRTEYLKDGQITESKQNRSIKTRCR